MDNFITISNVTPAEFESFIKSIGYTSKTDENFCLEAFQNSTQEEVLGASQYASFTKCDNSFFVMWLGKADDSGFKDIVYKLRDSFFQVDNEGKKEYRILVGNQKYKIFIKRRVTSNPNGDLASELFFLVKVN